MQAYYASELWKWGLSVVLEVVALIEYYMYIFLCNCISVWPMLQKNYYSFFYLTPQGARCSPDRWPQCPLNTIYTICCL